MSFSEWKDYSNLRPLGNRILVKRLPLTEVRESGLFIIGRDYPTIGRVVSVGNGKRNWSRKQHCRDDALGCLINEFVDDDGTICGPCHCHECPHTCWQGRRRGIYDIRENDLVQWSIDSNFDLKQIGRTSQGEDLFLFDYDDLNFVGREE